MKTEGECRLPTIRPGACNSIAVFARMFPCTTPPRTMTVATSISACTSAPSPMTSVSSLWISPRNTPSIRTRPSKWSLPSNSVPLPSSAVISVAGICCSIPTGLPGAGPCGQPAGWICQGSLEARMLPPRRMKAGTGKTASRLALGRAVVSFAVILASATSAIVARAHGGDTATTSSKKEATNPFRGSTFTFDQSITTQTADVGTTPQTYAPLYELWFSLRPRYWLSEHWVLRGRFDYSKQLTNNQQAADYATTKNQADVFGDIWTDFLYATKLDSL